MSLSGGVLQLTMNTPKLTEIEKGMSNFDHSIDEGLDDALRAGGVFGRHAAWNFNGRVWFSGGLFYEEVWCYGKPIGQHSAATLPELMQVVNDKYGHD